MHRAPRPAAQMQTDFSAAMTMIANPTEPSQMEQAPLANLLSVSSAILSQALDLVSNSLTSDEQLTTQSKYIPGSTIGKHLRHARDHFQLLLDCMSGSPPYVLNYDLRNRNRPMESSLQAAREELGSCIARLKEVVPKAQLDDTVVLNAVTPHMQVLQSSFGRELWFAGLHAVHHWSMIRVIAIEQGIQVEESFGVAPSTLVYRGKEASLGRAKI